MPSDNSNTDTEPLLQNPLPNQIPQTLHKKPSPYAVCIPMTIFIIIVGMLIGVLQQWIILYLCSRFPATGTVDMTEYSITNLPGFFHTDPLIDNPIWDTCSKNPGVQTQAAKWLMIISLCSSIPSLILQPIYGTLSDKIGRKPVILFPMIGVLFLATSILLVDYGVFGLWVMMFQAVISGLLGSYFVVVTALMAYFADTTDKKDRGHVFVIGESFIFIGFAFGPLLGGTIARNVDQGLRLVFWTTGALDLLIFAGTFLFLPESLKFDPDNANKTIMEKLSEMKGIKKQFLDMAKVFKTFLSPTFVCLVAVTCTLAASLTGKSLFFFYVSYKFGWDSQSEGQFTVISCLSRLVHMLITFPVLKWIFGNSLQVPLKKAVFDMTIIRASILVMAFCQLLYAMATHGYMMYIISFLDAFGTLCAPTARAILSSSVSSESQGLLFSGVSFVEHIFSLISSVMFPLLWAKTINTVSNAFFLVISALLSIGFGFSLFLASQRIVESGVEDEATRPLNTELFDQAEPN